MSLAQIGPLTGLLENAAAAVGAGMLLGGFVAGLIGIVRAWSRPVLDRSIFVTGYFGGAGALLVATVDIMFRYAL